MTKRELNVLFIISWPLLLIGLLALRSWIIQLWRHRPRQEHRSA